MKNLKDRKKEQGFTIIEVLIVLAIAGLIILIVFLAVPALQRNSRNTQRKNDIGALVGAYAESINNNSGQVPNSCDGSATTCWVRNAKMSNYDNQSLNVKFNKRTTAGSPAAVTDLDAVVITSFAKCGANGVADGANPTSRSITFQYAVETQGGVSSQCQES